MSGTDLQMDAAPQAETTPGAASPAEAAKPAAQGGHRGGLLAIGVFKLSKSIFFFCVGIGALHLVHKDLGNEIMRLAQELRFVDPESRLVLLLMKKADLIDAARLREIGLGTFAYSALALVEGIGLMLEKVWAEYLTLGLTIAFLPWELFELARQPNLFRLGLLLTNLVVLAYLVWFLRKKRKSQS